MSNNYVIQSNTSTEPNYFKAKRQDEETFIKNMVYLREVMGLKQSEMCIRIGYGLKFKTFQAWEEKRAFPPIFFCRRVSEIFKVDLEVMLTQRLVGTTT